MAERPRLIDRYDAFLLDLDGVVYLADQPIPGAVDAVATLLASGRRVVFMTNNSAPTPEEVMDRLGGFGIPEGADLVTSGMVTARLLAAGDGHPRSAFVIGEGGVRVALADAGVDVLEGEPGAADFVVVGWDRSVDFDKLRRATILVRRGARLVATNADASYPAPGGELWPGTGALLAAVETATGARATVVGKPHRPLFDAAVERTGSRRPLVIGDRMDTDVVGAADAGLDAALVLSGAHGPADLLDHDAVPVAVADDLASLLDRPAFPPIRSATAEDMEEVSALAAGDRGLRPDDTVVAADDRVEATATAVVRGPDALLRAVAVRQDRRGIGLGTLLVAAAVSDARRRGARRCWLLTETAEGFFIRLGFERADRASVPAWTASEGMADCREGAVAMHRELGQPSQPGR